MRMRRKKNLDKRLESCGNLIFSIESEDKNFNPAIEEKEYIDLEKYGMSAGEYRNIKAAVGSIDDLIDEKSKAYEKCFIKYLASKEAVEEKLLENQSLFKTPIVRNGKKATVGYKPEIWKEWE